MPNLIYRSLPYLFVIAGFIFVLIVESDVRHALVFVLFSTAFLLLWVRYSSNVERERLKRASHNHQLGRSHRRSTAYIHRSSDNRRIADAKGSFPIFDRSGMSINDERRMDERRQLIV